MTPNQILEQITPNLPKTTGIYMIYCLPANKAYIGQSKNISRRWYHHKNDLKHDKHANVYLQRVYNKYGKDSLHFSVLEITSELSEKEARFISLLDEDYKMNLGGVSGYLPVSLETRQKHAAKAIVTPQMCEAAKKANTGKSRSEETKRKISEANKGRVSNRRGVKLSQETKAKLSIAAKKQHHVRGNAGKFIKEEHGNK